MFIGDFHLHSTFSDGVLTIPQLVDLMGQSGVSAIAVTDHLCEQKTFLGKAAHWLDKSLNQYTFDHYLETIHFEAERAWKKYKMLVIPGVEITKNSFSHHDSAHILALDIQKYVNPDQPLESLLLEIKAQGALTIAAHPVHTGYKEHQTYLLWNNREKWEPLIDLWEVASGSRLFPEVQKSSLKKIANSDLHHPRQLRSWKTTFFCEKKMEAIKDDLLKQKIDFQYFEPQTRLHSIPGLRVLSQDLINIA